VSIGGTDDLNNLALACRNCNERRGNRVLGIDPITGESVTVFNPRHEKWSDHFEWEVNHVRIIGLTPTGRATVDLLDLNDDRHQHQIIKIRQRDFEDGYHPPKEDPVRQVE